MQPYKVRETEIDINIQSFILAPAGLCRSNERLLTCGCPRTCRNPALECKAVCQLGCFCEEGQVRNDEGLCVNLADCPPIRKCKGEILLCYF